ncbi:ABC transporter substrate-binding protein [Salinicola lusitanus]|uniref:ABC transporter substrate-binding protein n=1 Tax=Salinicola lusitanus TaxID=1949085 RepID=A0ABZ3CSK8_9GAMM
MTLDIRKTTLSALSAGLLGLLAAGPSQAFETPPTLNDGVLTVGMEIAYPPFESYDGDKVVGFDPEVAEALAERLDLKVDYFDTRFPNLILGLNSGRFDTIISGMYILPDRTKQADAIPYAKTGAAIMVTATSDGRPAEPEDLCGLTVGLQQGTSWVAKLNELSTRYCEANGEGPIDIREFPTSSETSQALLSGNIQAHMEILSAAHSIVDKSRGRIEITSDQAIYPETLGIYVKKGNDALYDALEATVKAFKQTDEYRELLERYNLEAA